MLLTDDHFKLQREVCCFTAKAWTKVIAWIQIVLYGALLLGMICWLRDLLPHYATLEARKIHGFGNDDDYITGILLIATVLGIFFSTLSLTMGFVLLKGTSSENIKLINAWLIYAALFLIIDLVTEAVNARSEDGGVVFRLLFSISLYGFGIWVVRIRGEEIQFNSRFNQPAYDKIPCVINHV